MVEMKTLTQRTNGPWKTDPKFEHETVIDSNVVMVASCRIPEQSCKKNRTNARLIAAAPELLACLEASTNAMISEREDIFDSFPVSGTDTEDNEEPSGERYFELCRLIDANQHAIMKAMGVKKK